MTILLKRKKQRTIIFAAFFLSRWRITKKIIIFARKVAKLVSAMRRPEIVERIRKEAVKLLPKVQTILYGSEARGDARQDSDIDLLLLVDADKLSYDDKDHIIAPFYDIELETGVNISALVLLRKDWENRPFMTPFQCNVNREGIVL